MISEALRVLPPIEDPYDDPHPGICYGPELRLRVYHVIKGRKVYYSGTPLPPGDGSELSETEDQDQDHLGSTEKNQPQAPKTRIQPTTGVAE
jgi:hypothetical protein